MTSRAPPPSCPASVTEGTTEAATGPPPDAPLLVITGDAPHPHEVLGLVQGVSVQASNLIKDTKEMVRNWLGGGMTNYDSLIERALAVAQERMVAQARALGADAVVNVRITTADVVTGGAEVIYYGTAVRWRGEGRSTPASDSAESWAES